VKRSETNHRMKPDYSVYVVELDESKRRGTANPAVYVGQTARTPEERLAQHLRHEKSSRHVRDHAVRLRPDLYEEYNPLATRADAEAKEAWLAGRLRAQGYDVYSN
jgi:GIY-YIG catalytic domain